MLSYKIIVNPVSGRGKGLASVPVIKHLLSEQAIHYDLVQSERPWHAAHLAEEAALGGYDVVVAAGGDGTANEVLNGLMAAKLSGRISSQIPAMGILCVGRGNDFAYGAHIPAELQAGCQALAGNYRRKLDVGLLIGGDFPQGRYFGNGVGIGFDAVVGFVAQKMKRLSGFPSYIVAALKTIFLYYQAPRVRIEFEGQSIETSALMISIMNGRRLGGGFMMAPQGQSDDGLFDLTIAAEVSRLRILTLIPHFLRGTQSTQREIRTAQACHVTVRALQGSLPIHADGETISTDTDQLSVELLPAQIDVLCSPEP